MNNSPTRLPGLDGLRAVAVSLVIVYHMFGMGGERHQGIARMGGLGVEIFFVLSGFLITHLLLAEECRHGSIDLGKFYGRRAIRIMPPLLLYLSAIAVITRLGLVAIPLRDFVTSLLFARNFVPIGSSWETAHCWTLAIEEQFYLIWPLLLIKVRQPRVRIALAFMLVCLLPAWRQGVYWFAGGADRVNSCRTDLRLIPIATGCLLALMVDRPRLRSILAKPMLRSNMARAVAIAVVGIASFGHLDRVRFARGLAQSVGCIGIAAIINASTLGAGTLWTMVLEARPVAWIGRLSYSLYLWQQPFTPGYGNSQIWYKTPPLNILFITGIACISYYGLERPAALLRRRLRPG